MKIERSNLKTFPVRGNRVCWLLKKLRYFRLHQIATFASSSAFKKKSESLGDLPRIEVRHWFGIVTKIDQDLSLMLTRTLCKCRAFRLQMKLQDLSVNRGIIFEIFRDNDPQLTIFCDCFKNNVIMDKY